MSIEIKKSKKPIKYEDAIEFMEQRLLEVNERKPNQFLPELTMCCDFI